MDLVYRAMYRALYICICIEGSMYTGSMYRALVYRGPISSLCAFSLPRLSSPVPPYHSLSTSLSLIWSPLASLGGNGMQRI